MVWGTTSELEKHGRLSGFWWARWTRPFGEPVRCARGTDADGEDSRPSEPGLGGVSVWQRCQSDQTFVPERDRRLTLSIAPPPNGKARMMSAPSRTAGTTRIAPGFRAGKRVEDLDLACIDEFLDRISFFVGIRDRTFLAGSKVQHLPLRKADFQRPLSLVEHCLHGCVPP